MFVVKLTSPGDLLYSLRFAVSALQARRRSAAPQRTIESALPLACTEPSQGVVMIDLYIARHGVR